MTDWFKKYGDKVGMECVQERHVHKSHPHKYPYTWCFEMVIDMTWLYM